MIHPPDPPVQIDRPLPADLVAERAVVGCALQTCWSPTLDEHPEWWTSVPLADLYISATILRDEGRLMTPRSDHAADLDLSARVNAERVAHLVTRSDWSERYAVDARYLLRQCLDEATTPWHLDWYVQRMREAYEQVVEITSAEQRLRAAWEAA